MISASEKSRWWSVTLFASSVTCFLALKLLGAYDLIDRQAECLLRLLIIGGLGTAVIVYSICTPIRLWLRIIVLLTIATVLVETVLDYTQGTPFPGGEPSVERAISTRRILQMVLLAGWICGGVAIAYLSVIAIRRRQQSNQLVDQLKSSQGMLKQSNERLASTLEKLDDTQRQLVQRERLSALGKMASGVAHDLNNTLAPVVMYSRLLADSKSHHTDEEKRWLATIEQCSRDAVSTIDGLKQFYCRDVCSSSLRRVALGELVRQAIDMTRPKWKDELEQFGRTISIDVDLPDCSSVQVNPTEIRVVVTNLIFNAVEAMPGGGRLSFRQVEQDDEVVLSVSDTGVGMSDEARLKCFEPFFTSKPRGSGLGLSICHGIIDRHAGTLHVESDSGGTTFFVRLPVAADARTGDTIAPPSKLNDHGRRRVLVVEDDDLVRESTTSLLSTLGTDVVAVADGRSGVAAFLNQGPFDLVITDLGMAGMDGRAVARAIRQQDPEQRIAIMSGWWDSDVRQHFSDGESPDILLQKSEMNEQLTSLLGLAAESDVS